MDMITDVPFRDEQIPVGASGFCEFPDCDSEIEGDGKVILVSIGHDTVVKRRACYVCSEIYTVGVQHGRMRAYRVLMELAEGNRKNGNNDWAGKLESAAHYVLNITDDPAEENAEWEHPNEEEG